MEQSIDLYRHAAELTFHVNIIVVASFLFLNKKKSKIYSMLFKYNINKYIKT
jgi:hypothetical protein